MLRITMAFSCLVLLAACSGVKPVEDRSDLTHQHGYSGLGYYAQARLAWNEGDSERALYLTRQSQQADPASPQPLMLEAEILLKAGQVQEALTVLDRAIAVAPDFRPPYLLGGTILSSLGKTREAADYLRQAVRLEPGKEDAVLHLVTLLMQMFEYEESVKVLKGLVKEKPESAVGNYYLGKVYSQMKLYREAIGYYQRALVIRPDFTQAAIDMAISHEALGEVDTAIATYTRVLDEADNRAPLIQHLIQLFIQRQRYDDALVYLERLQDMGLATTESRRKTGIIYLELERFDDAIKLFSEMLVADPDAHQLRVYLGVAYEEKEELDLAVAEFQKVPVSSMAYPEAVSHIAFIFKEQGKAEQAVTMLEQAIAANPDNLDLHLSLATLLDSLKRTDDGLQLLLQKQIQFASDAKFQFRLGVLYDKLGKRPLSIERMKKVVELNPDDAQAHNFLGYTYAEMGINLDEALIHIKRALELRPDDGFFIDSLGWVYYQMKRYDEAVRYLAKAAELVPDDPTILEHLGDAYAARKETRQALKFYRKARSLDAKKKGLEEKIRRLIRGDIEEQ